MHGGGHEFIDENAELRAKLAKVEEELTAYKLLGVIDHDEAAREVAAERDQATAERDLALTERDRLRSFVSDIADDGCAYNDNCPSGAYHYVCLPCKAKRAIEYARIGAT